MIYNDLLIVGIASSAGGIAPLTELLEQANCHHNMVFILVPHLSRDLKSSLPEIVKRVSRLKVEVITHNKIMEKCHLYVLPPGQYVKVQGGRLILEPRPERGINHSANVFFKSLASEYGPNAIGVVLSGASVGEDGSEGIIEIKSHGGHTYAQTPETAEFDGMPKAAIETGLIDSVMDARDIGHDLTLISWSSDSSSSIVPTASI